MTVLDPIRRGGNRANAPLIPPWQYDANLWLTMYSPDMGAHKRVHTIRLLANMNKGSRFYGPFRIPTLPNNMNIVGAYAHPFVWNVNFGTGTSSPSTGDDNVIRPAFAIRGKREIEMMLAPVDNVECYPGPLIGNTGITPAIDVVNAMRVIGDFFTDYAKDHALRGAEITDNIKQPTITHVETVGADPANPGYTIYSIQTNSGARLRISSTVLPVAGNPWPSTAFSSRFNYLVGQMQFVQSRLYAKRNMYPVPDRSPVPDHNQIVTDQSNPYAIMSVQIVYDYPSNPTTQIKKVTLVSGSTVTVSIGTVTIIGLEIGETSGTGDLQVTHDLADWAQFDVDLILAPDLGDETLSGMVYDVWPFWSCSTGTCP